MSRRYLATVLQFLGIGWYVALSIIGCTGGGLWLDRRFESMPILTLAGLSLGLATAGYGTYKMLKPLLDQNAIKSAEQDKENS